MQAEYFSADEDDDVVQPHFAWADLSQTWIGLGAALDWIIMRGQPLPLHVYQRLEDEAAVALVAALADMAPDLAKALVRGARKGKGPLVSIPAGIWKQTATSDAMDQDLPYRLVATDHHDEWMGSILHLHGSGYERVEIRAAFIRDTWPKHAKASHALPSRANAARAEIRRLIEGMQASLPDDLRPSTNFEIQRYVSDRLPRTSRDLVRSVIRELFPDRRPGPRGKRDPTRNVRFDNWAGI